MPTERLPYPDPARLPETVRAILAGRPTRNVFRMLGHAPGLVPGVMELTRAILYEGALAPTLRELAILRVGSLCGSAYEVHQHRKIAAAVGLDPARIDAALALDASDGPGASPLSDDERAALRLVDQVVRRVRADDATFADAVARFGAGGAVELVLITGAYVMLAQFLENTGVAIEDGTGPAQADVARIFAPQASPTDSPSLSPRSDA